LFEKELPEKALGEIFRKGCKVSTSFYGREDTFETFVKLYDFIVNIHTSFIISKMKL